MKIYKMKYNVLMLVFFIAVLVFVQGSRSAVASPKDTAHIQFNFEIGDGITDSSAYGVTVISNVSTLFNPAFELVLAGSETYSFDFDQNETIESDMNIIGAARESNFNGIEIYYNGSSSKDLLFTHNQPSGVRTHLGHIYYRWELGTPTPNGQGFALGAIHDIQLLSDLVKKSITTVAEANSLGESIVNTLLGTKVDYDGNGSAINPSDEYGFFTYSYGMRDHIKNAYTSFEASSELIDNGTQIFSSFAQYIGGGTQSAFEQGINTSSAIGAQIYNRSVELIKLTDTTGLSSILSDLQNLTGNFHDFVLGSYLGFRSIAMDFSFVSDITFETETTPTDTTADTTPFE
ncbi:MAG: hypothetical protein ACFFFG_15385, partial [Candidatus Thorarchaeota archaeon]